MIDQGCNMRGDRDLPWLSRASHHLGTWLPLIEKNDRRFRHRKEKRNEKIPVVKMFMALLPKMKSPISQNVQVVNRKPLNVSIFFSSKEIGNKSYRRETMP